jgi:signal transduction histidine kinase
MLSASSIDAGGDAPRVHPVLVSRYRTASAWIGAGVAALGAATLGGWAAGFEHGFLTSGALMKPNAAACFILLGVALLLARGRNRARAASLGLAAAAGALAVATLAEWLSGVDLGIDELLFQDDTLAYTTVPGRIAPNTTLAFAFYAAAILLQQREGRIARWWRALALCGLAIGAVGAAGHLYGVSRLYALAQATGMAMPAAAGLIVLGCGVLVARPEEGPSALLVDDGPGGTIARWLLPSVAVIPLILALPAQVGVRIGLLDQAYASALVTVGLTGVLAAIVVIGARAVEVRDAARRERERENLRLNEQLQRRAWELLVLNRELESFSYSVSHDLRSPLRSIDGFGQALIEDCASSLPPEGHEHVRRIRAATQRMGQLIDDLLQLSRVTRAELHRERVDLTAMARELVAELQRSNPGRVVTVEIGEDLVVNADPRLMRVVIENLLRNAWKFTSRHPSSRIVFGRCQHEGEPAFFVEDDGAGFDMAYAAKLFGAFQRLHGATEFPGTGVGLATVQRIVHRHGGAIWAEGAVELGARFTFTVPPEPEGEESAA